MVPEPRSVYALKFFFTAVVLLSTALGLAKLLIAAFPAEAGLSSWRTVTAFAISTSFLFCGSGCLYGALISVRRERQKPFRRWVCAALASGIAFVAVQTYALSSLLRQRGAEEFSEETATFVALFATLHAVHFLIAFLCLTYVAVQAFADRYDHEYFWGITFCSWFWHALVIVWIAILFVMILTRLYA